MARPNDGVPDCLHRHRRIVFVPAAGMASGITQ